MRIKHDMSYTAKHKTKSPDPETEKEQWPVRRSEQSCPGQDRQQGKGALSAGYWRRVHPPSEQSNSGTSTKWAVTREKMMPQSAGTRGQLRGKVHHAWLSVTPWTAAHQAPLSVGFSRQEYWRGLLCPPRRELPNPQIEQASLMSPCIGRRVLYH